MKARSIPGLLAVVLAASSVSCKQRPSPASARETAAVRLDVESEPDSINPATGVEPSCLFDTTQIHRDPQALAREFLARDAAGQFLGSTPWFDGATDCPGHEPGPDTFTLVDHYSVRQLTTTDTSVQFSVTYQVLGYVHGDSSGQAVFKEHLETLVDTLRVRRTSYGWRVRGPALWQRVLADSVVADKHYRPQVLDAIRQARTRAVR